MGKISRKNVDYFEMFVKSATIARNAARKLQAAFAHGEVNISELKLVKDLEHEGDIHFHECLKVIEVAFITPIDRSDLVGVLKGIEDVTDSIEAIANSFHMMCITSSSDSMRTFVDLVVLSCEKVLELMVELKRFKKTVKNINSLIVEINHLEEEGDRFYSESMRSLFSEETDAITVIKNKELYQLFEFAIDCCEDVADMVENIIVTKT
ncbi:MAG: DUF47 family protein [Clostridiales bacterium]|nr:DUF47 family protein [Clostridiales bacterium]